jgi:PPOX class probable F420-dependent enzyme
MSDELTDFDYELLQGSNFAHVSVNRPDGSPHVTVVWIDARDGHVLINTAVGRVKDRLVRRDPRLTVSVHQEGDAYRWLRVEGTVVEFVTGEEADRHIDFLNRKYHDGEAWESTPGQQRVIYRVRPDKILRREE